jgi:hypothetical protein
MIQVDSQRRRLLGAGAALGLGMAPTVGQAQAPAPAREIEGFRFDGSARVGGVDLVLNGVGVRKRFFIPVYVAGLYVPQRSSDPETLLRQRGPRRMAMRFVREVEAELFMTSLNEGMRKNYGASQLAAWRPQIETLTTVISTMVLARRADNITWDFTEEGGRIMQNSVPRVPSIPGEDFYNAVLRVWLGEQPADAELKRGLLGT